MPRQARVLKSGKARAALNARRHGLSLSVTSNPVFAEKVETLAREFAGRSRDPEIGQLAHDVAEAQIDLVRIRLARHDLLARDLDDANYAEAAKWYQLAASEGYADAQFNLGVMYEEGQAMAQNYAEAVRWYRLAASQGNALAQNNLGVKYALGRGVPRDDIRGHMWLSLAAASAIPGAVKARDNLAKEMSPQQIAQAQQMASDCQQRNFKGCD